MLLEYIFPGLTFVDFPQTLTWTDASLWTGPETTEREPLLETGKSNQTEPTQQADTFSELANLHSRSKQLCKFRGCLVLHMFFFVSA